MGNETAGSTAISLIHGLGRPAQQALAVAGYQQLEQLTTVSEAEILRLHGVGPKALNRLREVMVAQVLSFADQQ